MCDDVCWMCAQPGAFVHATPRLSSLINHPKIAGICEGTLGKGYTMGGGDGNFYSGDTGWCTAAKPCPW